MTDQEFKQIIATAPVDRVMPLLQEAETALNAVYPVARRYVELSMDKEEAEKSKENAIASARMDKHAAIIFLVAAVPLFVIGFILTKNLLSLIFRFLCIGALVCMAVQYVQLRMAKSMIKKATEQVNALTHQVAEAEAQLNQVKAKYQDGLVLRQMMTPDACKDPKYLRQFIHYLEEGRASNLREARNLFDEFMHRQRMEDMAASQVQAAQAAEQAAYAAMQASQQAAADANSAKTSADWAAYQARYHIK